MTLEFKPGIYYARIFFLPLDGLDVMGGVYRVGDGPWQAKYRFRYYAETGNDDDDEKSWTHLNTKETGPVGPILAKFKVPFEAMAAACNVEIHWLIVESDDPEVAMGMLAKESWAHFKRMDVRPPGAEPAGAGE